MLRAQCFCTSYRVVNIQYNGHLFTFDVWLHHTTNVYSMDKLALLQRFLAGNPQVAMWHYTHIHTHKTIT